MGQTSMLSNPKCQDTFNTLTPLKKKKTSAAQFWHVFGFASSAGTYVLHKFPTVLPDVISKRKDGLKLKILGKYIVQT